MRNWYGLDETREPWCFLSLASDREHETSPLTGWTLGVGNPDQLLSTENQQVHSDDDEVDILVALGKELDERRYTGTTLVTNSRRTLAHLRQRLMACGAFHSPTLRGFDHIALDDVLTRYLAVDSISEFEEHCEPPLLGVESGNRTSVDNPLSAVEQLWQAWSTVYRLVPATVCQGDPL